MNSTRRTYDLELFTALNKEYAKEPIVKAPRSHNDEDLEVQARRRSESLDKRFGLRGKRVLEIGCGAGHLCKLLQDHLGCEVIGVDVEKYNQWDGFIADGADLRLHDITLGDNAALGQFDRIYSYAVWEHMVRPLEGIDAVRGLLTDDGQAYIAANLYRGQTASHRYRQIHFPWPHLLFDDEVFKQYYLANGLNAKGPAWVNKLTAAQYRERFQQNDLAIAKEWATTRSDPEFAKRFEDKLGKYPTSDLELDFIHVILQKGTADVGHLTQQVVELEDELQRMRGATFWRMSAPVRKVLDAQPTLKRRAKSTLKCLRRSQSK